MNKILFLITVFYTTLTYAETVVPMDAQINLNVTIYNDNRALIKDERQISLTPGLNELAFSGVSANMMPQTAVLSGVGLTTLEQNFNFDLLSQESLLQKSVGQTVHTEYIDPATGKIIPGSAKLIAYNNGSPVLKIGEKIETKFPGRIIFNKVPENLRSKPTLVVSVQSEGEITEPVKLDYLTTGLSWSADYVAQLDANEKLMNLNGFVTLTNHSGTDYNNANLQLVAGEINTLHEERVLYDAPSRMMKAMAVNGAIMEAENLSDFYIYTVPHKTTLLSNQTKQVALLSGAEIGVNKTYEIDNIFSVYSDEIKKVKPQIYLTFENSTKNKLGLPLPKGVVRLYKQDSKGGTQFVGEDRIYHTADKETVRLKMGEAFNLTADMKRTSYNKISDRTTTAGFEITLKNGGDTPATVDVKQSFPNGYKLLEQSVESQKLTSNQVKWQIQIPAKGETKFTYKVRWEN